MAGSNPAFNPNEFRTNIINTMNMGLPTDTSLRPTFRWRTERTYSVADPGGNPYDFTAPATSTTAHADVQIPCAVQFVSTRTNDEGTVFGVFNSPRVILTVLDTHFPDVDGATEVVLGGNTYQIEYVEPPIGLFEVTVYQIHAQAKDES